MITVIKNGNVITMDEKRKKMEKLDIVIENDSIKELSINYTGEYDEIIDATNKIVMPGLINCHTHLGMSIFRATNDNLNLNDWLTKKIWPIEDHMKDQETYYTTLLSCLEMIKTGTTCFNDMYFACNGSLKAIKEAKIRGVFSRCLMDNDEYGEQRIQEFIGLYNENKNSKLIKFAVAPHALYTCSEQYLKGCSDLALELNIPFHIHFCENTSEVDGIIQKYHCDPVEALEKIGILRNKTILAHGTFISDKGLELLKGKDVSIAHNPVSNLNLGCGIADISKYKNYVNLCLGTDGQGSGNNLNLFYHMSFVDFLQKGKYQDPTVWNSYDTLKMATINGAKALGLDKEIGSIEVGKKADIIILDLNNTEIYPGVDIITNVVHNVESNNIDTTIINGEILMKNHELCLSIDETNLKNNINKILNELNMEKSS